MTLVPEGTPGAVAVVVTSLEQTDPSQLRPSRRPPGEVALVTVEPGDPATTAGLSAWFYREVGADWAWVDRLGWSAEQWRTWVDRPEHTLLVLLVDGERAGYAELEQQPGGDVELAYLGLLPGRGGRGLGGWLLTEALRRAWALPATRRVWVHTCTLDGPHALANYRARGMVPYWQGVEHRLP